MVGPKIGNGVKRFIGSRSIEMKLIVKFTWF